MDGNQLAMVSEWMANGNINRFANTHMEANRFELVGFFHPLPSQSSLVVTSFLQLKDVAKGLIYMHGEGMIHGDLKGVGGRTSTSHCFLISFLKGEHPD